MDVALHPSSDSDRGLLPVPAKQALPGLPRRHCGYLGGQDPRVVLPRGRVFLAALLHQGSELELK